MRSTHLNGKLTKCQPPVFKRCSLEGLINDILSPEEIQAIEVRLGTGEALYLLCAAVKAEVACV